MMNSSAHRTIGVKSGMAPPALQIGCSSKFKVNEGGLRSIKAILFIFSLDLKPILHLKPRFAPIANLSYTPPC